MEQARPVKPPVPIGKRCYRDPTARAADPAGRRHQVRLRRRRARPRSSGGTRASIAGLDIIGFDGISDSGEEIYNFCEQEGIKNIVLMGVHTNICVLARPFGIRQMLTPRQERRPGPRPDRCALRSATAAPREPCPRHRDGRRAHRELLCPSILSADLTRVVPGSDGPVKP